MDKNLPSKSGGLPFYLGFSYFMGIGPLKFDQLIANFKTIEKAYTASANDIQPILGPTTTQKFIEFRNSFQTKEEIKKIEQANITVLTREHPQYPLALKHISDSPICLYVKGNIEAYDFTEDNYFAIVGTRDPTAYGQEIASKFAFDLAEAGFVIVSGMAKGIDAYAHWGALKAKGNTIAVLGCGVNIIYPHTNSTLYREIIKNGGLVMSEFPPDMMVKKGMFVSRNRIVSGLCKGILVAEGLKDSGSLITASHAANQGKDVFAPPAPITSKQSQAPNILLKQGAKLATSVDDILEEYNMKLKPKQKDDISASLGSGEKKLFELLSRESFSSDELARATGQPVSAVLSALSSLEIQGVIQKGRDGKYCIKL